MDELVVNKYFLYPAKDDKVDGTEKLVRMKL